ncbi:MAG: hypothetical protein HQL99_05055 [Magnetococcales bacterium]|nr:hypothetical protein [Magnetococcales bacterium]
MFEWIVTVINHPATPWVPALLIPLWAVAMWWSARKNLLDPLLTQIRLAREQLDTIPDAPTAFPSHLSDLDSRLNALPDLTKAWRHFTATWIPLGPPEPIFLYGQRPEQFFRLDPLTTDNPRAQRLQTLPHHLAVAGLIFTFAGLVGALHYASRGLLSGEPETVRMALRGVLAMASLKFLASIAGFCSAWMVSWRLRVWQSRLEQELAVWCDQLASRLVFITPERLAHEQMNAMERLRPPVAPESEPAPMTVTLSAATLEPLIQTLRTENHKLTTLIQARLPDPATQTADLRILNTTLLDASERLGHLLETLTLNLQPALETDHAPLTDTLPRESAVTHWVTATPPASPDPALWRPMIESLRDEGRHLAQELAHHLARELQTGGVRPHADGSQHLSRPEQESWMRIIDRMELAARALEKQSESLNGLSALANETRRASEGSIRAGREAVESLVNAVEHFNTRMESTFSRSAEALLNRLAQNNQQVVSQMLEGLDRERADTLLIPPEPELKDRELPRLFDQFMRTRGAGKRQNPGG